jgi:hypothetical protein
MAGRNVPPLFFHQLVLINFNREAGSGRGAFVEERRFNAA